MKAWVLEQTSDMLEGADPLVLRDLEVPRPGPGTLLVKVSACGVCHTELDAIEGRLPARLPVVPGHQVIGRVAETGEGAGRFRPGERIGVAWIYSACGSCSFCQEGRENLCSSFAGTGVDADGGYAWFMTVPEAFAFHVPAEFSDTEAAPLLCAGAIGFRSLNLTGLRNGHPVGLSGFGGSAHLVLKMIRYKFPDTPVYVFARSQGSRSFALEMGAEWAGDFSGPTPVPLSAVIDTTPAWTPVLVSLASLAPGGKLVINAIRKEDRDRQVMADIDYRDHLWREKEIQSVANVCRRDVTGFLDLAAEADIKPDLEVYPFTGANRALHDLKAGSSRGAKVIKVES